MKTRFYALATCLTLCLFLTGYGQNRVDPEVLEAQIADLEARDINEFAASVKQIYEESLLHLYKSYIAALNRQIELLENIPDPIGDFAKKRIEYVKKRDAAKTKADILEVHLKLAVRGAATPVDPGSRMSDQGQKPPTPQTSASSTGIDARTGLTREPAKLSADRDEPQKRNAVAPQTAATSDCKENIVVGSIDTSANKFLDASPAILDDAKVAARRILETIDPTTTGGDTPFQASKYSDLFYKTVARSIESEKDTASAVVNLQPLRYLPETYRTDKQIGASSGTAAATSAADKPGFAWLLGFAIENGYVEKDVQDTVLTLSTSPAAFLAVRNRNFNDAYQQAGLLNRIGISASFNINGANPLLNNVSRTQLRDYSIRFRFLGDHSANSRRLQEIWDDTIAPKIRAQLVAVGQLKEFVDETKSLRDLRECTAEAFSKALTTRLESSDFKALGADKREADLTNFYLNFMKLVVVDRVRSGQTGLDDSVKTELRMRMSNLLEVQKNFAFQTIKDALDDFFKRPIGTFAYINHRDPLGNYSEFKVLYQQTDSFLKPLTLTANAGYSFYHQPDPALNQKKTRDFNFALAFEGKSDSPFAEDGDFSQITYSFAGRYVRFLENQTMPNRKADLLSGTFLLTVPVFKGFILPFSITYSNATELERRAGVRVNFGLKLDTEKLFALTRGSSLF